MLFTDGTEHSIYMSHLLDKRVGCWSVMVETNVEHYLKLTDTAYNARGGLKHQRDALKSTSGRRIRSRMIEDIKRGAVLPPIVIGIVAEEASFQDFDSKNVYALLTKISAEFSGSLAIIDGMQRTTALLEAVKESHFVNEHPVRLEVWIAKNTDSLIYRILVLNTRQVPWNLKQQLGVVYEPLIKSIEDKVKISRLLREGERRWNGGEFSTDSLIEAYIAFGLRRTKVDTQESLADEFSRLDIADALTEKKFDHYFYPVVQMMIDYDIAISRYNPAKVQDEGADADSRGPGSRDYNRGQNVFDRQPARIGFIVANAIAILGRVGMDKTEIFSQEKLVKLLASSKDALEVIQLMDLESLQDYLALDVLEEKLSRRPTSAVGRWERSFFESAFKVLVEEDYDVPSLEACWRA